MTQETSEQNTGVQNTPEQKLSLTTLWRSKLARRLVPLFIAVVCLPLIVTVLIVGRVGQEQIVATAHSMQAINGTAVQDAGQEFQRLGKATVRRSGTRMTTTSLKASRAVSQQWEKNQAAALGTTAHEFSHVTQSSIDGAMHQSLATNQDILSNVSGQMGQLFANSARDAQGRVADRVQSAILAQIDTQMHERARQLAQLVTDYLQTYQNYLNLTAQMLTLSEGQPGGQKAILDALVRRYPMLVVVSVLDKKGKETAMSASDHAVTQSDLGDRAGTPDFKTAMTDQPYVGMEQTAGAGRAPVLRLAVPVELYRGKAVGALTARLSLDDLWDTIRSTRLGKSGFATVLDRNGAPLLAARSPGGPLLSQSAPIDALDWRLVVAQSRDEVMAPVQSFRSDIAQNTQRSLTQMHGDIQASSHVAAARFQGNARTLSARTVAQAQARTLQIFQEFRRKTARQTEAELSQMQDAIQRQTRQAQSENDRQMTEAATTASSRLADRLPAMTSLALNRANRSLSLFALIIIACSCALSCLIALGLAGAIVRPILRLAQGTRALAQGELSRRVDERAPAEIGDLAVAFNTMALFLQQSRSDLNDAEAQLVQSAKLASLGTLSAGIAHELNQPVAIVRGISQQLQGEPGLSADVQEDLALIEGQTGRMMKIIKHLRTFCRSGGYEMNDIEVNRVIRDCFILIDAQLKAHDVSVDLELCDAEAIVTGDANELEQVFINLITNARDAMEGVPNATLTIRSRLDSETGQLVLEFHDSGTGIPAEVAAHIFDPFFTTKEAGKGTGLGLSISYNIIKKHQGTITVHNDGGAVFTITLPLAGHGASTGQPEVTLALAA